MLPWNLPVFELSKATSESQTCRFPKIDEVAAGYIFNWRNNIVIEGEVGRFIGSYDAGTLQPSGQGVFITHDWIHCGEV